MSSSSSNNSVLGWFLLTAIAVYTGFYIPRGYEKIKGWNTSTADTIRANVDTIKAEIDTIKSSLQIDSLKSGEPQTLVSERRGIRQSNHPLEADDIIFMVIVFLIIFYSIFHSYLDRLVQVISYKLNRMYSDFIYNYLKVRIEYMDTTGHLVSFCRTDHISKLSLKRSKRMLSIQIDTDGTIVKDKTSAINSGFTFPSNSTVNFECYFYDDNIIEREHHSSYAFLLEDGFLNSTEYWIFTAKNYCKLYTLEVIIPSGRTIKEVELFYQRKDINQRTSVRQNSTNWILVARPKIMIIYEPQKATIVTHVSALKPIDNYMLVWTLN